MSDKRPILASNDHQVDQGVCVPTGKPRRSARAQRRPALSALHHPVAYSTLRQHQRAARFTALTRPGVDTLDMSRLWRPADARIELTVVVPFYNPGPALRRTVDGLVTCLREHHLQFEVIAVSDGSTDGSERTLDDLGPEVRVVVSPTNRGKGDALHEGFARARGTWVGFVDADGDIDPAHLVDYLQIARVERPAAVYADKRHTASTSAATFLRKIISIVYSTLVTMLFMLGVRDTQTGCKLIRRDVLATVLPRLRELGFAFDLEFFVAARAAGFHHLVGAPVHLRARMAGSSVTSAAILRTIRSTFAIFGRCYLLGRYTPTSAHPTTRLRSVTADRSAAVRFVIGHAAELAPRTSLTTAA